MKKIFLLLGLIILAGCIAPPEQKLPEKIRVGYLTADLHHVAYFVAKNPAAGGGKSIFEKYGLEVEDAASGGYPHGGAAMDGFAANKIDIAVFGSPPAITKHLNAGVDTKVVAQVNEIGSALVVAKNIKSAAELQGKTIAVPSHSAIQYFLLLNFLKQNGIDVAKITTIDVAPKDMRAKLEKGDISGFVAWEPFVADAVVANSGVVLAYSNDILPHHLDCVVVADRKFAEQRSEAVVRFLKAHIEATDWINKAKANPNSAEYKLLVQISVNFTGRSEEVVKEALKYIDYKYKIDASFRNSFRDYTNKLVQFKIIGEDKLKERGYAGVDEFVMRYIDDSYLRKAKTL